MTNAAENEDELSDVPMADDYSTLHTFWLVSAAAELIADYSERVYDKVKFYSTRFQEFLFREWDVLFTRSNTNTTTQIMKSEANHIEKEESNHLKNDVTMTINV